MWEFLGTLAGSTAGATFLTYLGRRFSADHTQENVQKWMVRKETLDKLPAESPTARFLRRSMEAKICDELIKERLNEIFPRTRILDVVSVVASVLAFLIFGLLTIIAFQLQDPVTIWTMAICSILAATGLVIYCLDVLRQRKQFNAKLGALREQYGITQALTFEDSEPKNIMD